MAVSWSAVFAGSVVMAGVSLILIPIGAGLGFTAASALHFHDYSAMPGATGAAMVWTSLVSGAGSRMYVRVEEGPDVAGTHLLSSAVLLLGLSMLVGAFIAAVAAVAGGHLRDEHGPGTQPPI